MEHPLISNIDHLSIEELQKMISELTQKLGIAHRMGNSHLTAQIRMALETYQNKHREKLQAIYDAANSKGTDFSNKIDIS
jgi:uncharacterized protein YfkK (UPF0435 family)